MERLSSDMEQQQNQEQQQQLKRHESQGFEHSTEAYCINRIVFNLCYGFE
jgi:hypothetical protein